MKVVKFTYQLKSNDLLTKLEGNCFYYEEKQVLAFKEKNGTQVFVDLNHFLLTRENEEMILVLDFNNGNSYVQMKKMNQKIDMPTKIKYRKLENNKFMVNYVLSEQNNFEFEIEWTLGGE